MKILIDNQIVKNLVHNTPKMSENSLLSNENQISFRWPSLLEYLGLGSLFSTLPTYDQTHPLFVASISTLQTNEDREVLFYVYDRLFAENLTQLKALPQINASFLCQAIKEKCENATVLSPALTAYEEALIKNASHTMHDLILYLAWDRMCVCMARLFNYQSTNPKFIKGLDVLKGCLIESYQHIVQQGRTSPGLYRMIESLFFYQMREENLQKHTDAEWTLLSQSFQVLKSEDELVDFFYIDDGVITEGEVTTEGENEECYLTLDTPERVNSRVALAQLMMAKLKAEIPDWRYILRPKNIIYYTNECS